MSHKQLLALFVIAIFLLPLPVGAVSPDFDAQCFTREECAALRVTQYGVNEEEAALGWVRDEGNCQSTGVNPAEQWGKCLPAGITAAEVSFGGKTEFLHLGDYIKTVYSYGIGIAGILSVIMIIVAGVEWVSSGGNSEIVTSAKKRIGGAIIGLLLAYFSYAILNTINPALVNFRLPQVWMIKTRPLVPQYCRDLKPDQLLASAGLSTREVNELPDNLVYDISPSDTNKQICGEQYFIQGAGASVCQGSYCQNGVCFPDENRENNYRCQDYNMYVVIRDSNFVPGVTGEFCGWDFPFAEEGPLSGLFYACNISSILGPTLPGGGYAGGDRGGNKIGTWQHIKDDAVQKTQTFKVKVDAKQLDNLCSGNSLKGLYLQLDLNEKCSLPLVNIDDRARVGRGGIDLGTDSASWELSTNDLFSAEQIRNGLLLDLDLNNIRNE